VFGPRTGLYTAGLVSSSDPCDLNARLVTMKPWSTVFGGTDSGSDCDGAGLVMPISTCGESRSRVVEGTLCRQGVSKIRDEVFCRAHIVQLWNLPG